MDRLNSIVIKMEELLDSLKELLSVDNQFNASDGNNKIEHSSKVFKVKKAFSVISVSEEIATPILITISFIHPTDGRQVDATVDNRMTVKEAITELIGANFLPPSQDGYDLAIKGGAALQNEQTFVSGGVESGASLRVIPATAAC